ncbi:leucine-rich repeat-containing protein 45-like isoform X2 [Octopus sinensis]|uniref:Leucine-rich repeat-containing protein 45-like isoform X2 n=1 Tax=Octopus sinensis TaxID=2607531 RepID=A0A7E6ERK4_9MOLL|nr:leucine-rich repeat-containing protein 45-like isoform X2 [Octopus sinensis]
MGMFFTLFLKLCKEKHLKPDSELLERLPRNDTLLLDLSHMSICADMCGILGKALSFDETINELRFSDCMICPEGMQAILHGLASNTSVRKLNLKGNQIRGNTVESLGYMLRNNNCLTSICLEWNDLGILETPFIVFCDGLQANCNLRRLDIRNNQVTHHGAKQLAEALSSNKTLQVIESSLQCNQKLQLMKTNCKHKTHILCKQYRHLESENKKQVLNLMDKLSCTQGYLNHEKRNSGHQLMQLKETLKEKNQAFNELFSKFTETDTQLTLMKEKSSSQEECIKKLQEQLSGLKAQFQKELHQEREEFRNKEKNLVKDLSKASSKSIQLECKLSDSETKCHALQEQVYELKEHIACLHSEIELKEAQNKDMLEQKRNEFNEKIKQFEGIQKKEQLQQKESWENLETNLRNQIQKSEQSRLALEEDVASLKTANIALRVKAEEDIAILKAGIKTDNDLRYEQLQNKIFLIESSKEDFKKQWETSQQQLNDMNNKLARKETEKEAETGKYKMEINQLHSKLDAEAQIQRELKNKLLEMEQKLSEHDNIYKVMMKKHEVELASLHEQLRTKGSQLNCLCDEVTQRAQSLQSAVSITRTSLS